MINIMYNPTEYPALADALIADYVSTAISTHARLSSDNPDFCLKVETGCEAVLDTFRVAVKQGLLSCADLSFHYDGHVMRVDDNAKFLTKPPEGFCDHKAVKLAFLALKDVGNRKYL